MGCLCVVVVVHTQMAQLCCVVGKMKNKERRRRDERELIEFFLISFCFSFFNWFLF